MMVPMRARCNSVLFILFFLFVSWNLRQGSRPEHRLVDDHDALTTALQFDFSIATFIGWDLSGPFRSICMCAFRSGSRSALAISRLHFAFAWSRKALISSRPPLCDLDISGLSTLCVTISCASWLSFFLVFFSMLLGELRYTSVYFLYTSEGGVMGFAFVTPFGFVGLVFSFSLRVLLFPMLLGPWRYYLLTKLGFILLRYGFWGATLPPSRLGVFAEVKKLKVYGTS